MKYCSNPAGKGTDHRGSGRCHVHGGCGGAEKTPKGLVTCATVNLIHGKYSKLFRAYLLNRHGEDAEEILELLQDPEGISALLDLTTAKLLVTFEQTGDLRCVDLALKCLKEALKTPKSKVEVGEEGEEDPAERIVKKLELKIEVRENVSDKPRES